jgi:hypothetical protein
MRRLSFPPRAVPLAVAVGALALAACSDSIVSPTRSLAAASDASLSVTPGTNSLTIVSDGATLYCSTSQLNGDYTIPANPFVGAGCGAGTLNLTAAINVYNPGWSQPFTGSSWIGITTKGGPSSDYRPNPGRYVFQETFAIPASVTSPVLDLHVKSDNVAAVYLNGKNIGQQALTDCNAGTCNWNTDLHIVDNTAADFVIGGSNTLTFLVIDLPTGFPVLTAPTGGPAPQYGCPTRPFQVNGTAGYTATLVPTSPAHVIAGGGAGTSLTNIGLANQAGCENPMGLDFAATMSWTPPQICDFITFGRLVTTVGDDKVVISGNAGGNAPSGGILGEIEIAIGGVQYHVSTIDSYGPTTNAPLFPDPFARVIKGNSGAHTIELRLRDDPNPGQGEPTAEGDKVWLKIDGVVVVSTRTPDQGNIQLHLNCRGPGD